MPLDPNHGNNRPRLPDLRRDDGIYIGLHGCKGLVVVSSQFPVSGNSSEQHSQTNGYTIARVSMLPGPRMRHEVGGRDL